MTTYNGARFLPQQLNSIASQTLLPDEIVIGDDQSSDSTADCVRSFARRHPKIQVHFERNRQRLGSTANFESALRWAAGDVVLFSDQDDVWYPDRVERTVAAFGADPARAYVFSNGDLIDEQGKRLAGTLFDSVGFRLAERRAFQAGRGMEVLLRRNVVTGATLGVRRHALDAVLPFEPGWIHDYWIALMLQAGHGSCVIDRPLIQYRLHASQQVGVARGSLKTAVAYARKQGLQHCRAEAQAWGRLASRLRRQGLDDRHPIAMAVSAKSDFIGTRAHMRERPWLAPTLISGALIDGRYTRYSLGLKQAFVDALSAGLAGLGRTRHLG